MSDEKHKEISRLSSTLIEKMPKNHSFRHGRAGSKSLLRLISYINPVNE